MGPRKLVLAAAGLVAGVAVAWLMSSNHVRGSSTLQVTLVLVIGWSFIAAGLVAWHQRPDNLIGPAMVVVGFLRFAAALYASQDRMLFAIGHSLEAAYLAGVIFVVLAFPVGRLETTFHRWLFVLAVVAVGPLDVGRLALGGHEPCAGCPERVAVQVADLPVAATSLQLATYVVGGSVAISSVVVLVRRWQRATPRLRLAIAPVLWVGAAGFASVFVMVLNHAVGEPAGNAPHVLLDIATAGLAFAFLLGLGRTQLARSAVADLVRDLGNTPAPGDLRLALARTLRDPTVDIAYWLPDAGRYVDAEGHPVSLPGADAQRAVTTVSRDGRTIAALLHDPALRQEQRLVDSVGAAAGLALENERLQAELRARLAELSASRMRLVEAAQEERRRIERVLHDGTQQRLVSVAMTLGLADSRLAADPDSAEALLREARTSLSEAMQDLRELSHGIHPGILTERGLGPALEELAARSHLPVDLDVSLPGRRSEQVETTTYFFVSEALTNVAKHAHATTVRVNVSSVDSATVIRVEDDGAGGADPRSGSGLRGLRDRIEALGGRFTVTSGPDEGTVVEAVIPCG